MKKNIAHLIPFWLFLFLSFFPTPSSNGADTHKENIWKQAEHNGEKARQAFLRCREYVRGWLSHADSKSGLIPRNLDRDPYWNAQDAAADNYPFMVLTSALIDRPLFEGRMREMLEAERRLSSRVGPLPDDFLFATQSFRHDAPDLDRIIFGASEYVKDGLLPLTEWLGPSPWQDRMLELVDAIIERSPVETPFGMVPAVDHEVGGEMMQVLSRLFWMTGKQEYRVMAFRLADYFLLHALPIEQERLSLDDHGCEVIGGLSEVYLLAAKTDLPRYSRYKKPVHDLLDRILDTGRNPDGLFYMLINPVKREVLNEELTDNWGYDYNAYFSVGMVDGDSSYLDAVRFALENLHRSQGYPWEGGGADGYADSIESALNLINRIPVESAMAWVDHEIETMLRKQQDDGIIEGWHGDGNFARTALMYALWKTQGCRIDRWRADVSVGAAQVGGKLFISIRSRWPWTGHLLLDKPRHREYFQLPMDYPRLNQFPEWFTAERAKRYKLAFENGEETEVSGENLWQGIEIRSKGGEDDGTNIRIMILPTNQVQKRGQS